MKKRLRIWIDIISTVIIVGLLSISTFYTNKENNCNKVTYNLIEEENEKFFLMIMRYFYVQDKNTGKLEMLIKGDPDYDEKHVKNTEEDRQFMTERAKEVNALNKEINEQKDICNNYGFRAQIFLIAGLVFIIILFILKLYQLNI